jgi:hypothetical protein
MKLKPALLAAATLTCFTSIGLAQGADACANAQPIVGLGVFNFDNTLATTDGGPDPLCLAFGQDSIEFDVWFSWVAPNDGTFIVDTCNQTVIDTKLGIYDGTCSGAVIACNDDTCSLQSSASWQAMAGQTYLIRLGIYPGATSGPGTGTFTITEDVPVLNPGNGNYYQAIANPGITWAQANIDAQAATFNGVAGHLATLTDQAENDFVFTIGDVHWHFLGGFQNLSSPNYSEPAGGWEWVTGEAWSYTNWWPGEPNDTGPTGPEHTLELLQGGQYGESWNDVADVHSRGYVIEFETGVVSDPGTALCFGDGTGATCPCGQFGSIGEGCQNTGGIGAILVGSGNASLANDTFQLDISGVPGAKPGLLVKGSTSFQNPVGDGILCTSPQQRSHVQITMSDGSTTFTDFDGNPFGAISNSGGVPTYYQFWYRDPGNTCSGQGFNFTNAWTTTWTP